MNWGGDSSCIFSADSPNFGGLVCSTTVVSADLWKLGQVKPGDNFIMVPVSLKDALLQRSRVESYISTVQKAVQELHLDGPKLTWNLPRGKVLENGAILKEIKPTGKDSLRPKVTYRQVSFYPMTGNLYFANYCVGWRQLPTY